MINPINALQERIIWCFWLGDKQMSFFRRLSFSILKLFSGAKVILLTDKSLKEYELKNDPFHKSYYLLSATQKSDYLRCYFMYHYGGGYSDIKGFYFNWKPYFKMLENSDKDFVGTAEGSSADIASNKVEVRNAYKNLASNGFYIHKAKSFFAKEWKRKVDNLLDKVYPQLKKQDGLYHPRAIKGGIHNPIKEELLKKFPKHYPLRWAEINGEILHQLEFENQDRFLLKMPYPYNKFIYRLLPYR